ncbi:MAG: DUF1569 domain-containing protein [Flavobacterium sp.]
MPSIFNPKDNSLLTERLSKLKPDAQPKWGVMNAEQMMAHCLSPIEVAFGNMTLKSNIFMRIIGKLYKNKILQSPRFKKNSPTVPEFVKKGNYDFEKTKGALIKAIESFAENGHSVIKNTKHPFFGNMTYEEWDQLQWKHLDHHFRQFDV